MNDDELQQRLMTRFYQEIAKRSPNLAVNPSADRIMSAAEHHAFEAAVNGVIAWLAIAAVAESVRQAGAS